MRNKLSSVLAVFGVLLLVGCQARQEVVLVSNQAEESIEHARGVSEKVRPAALALLKSLTDKQKALAMRPVNDPLRKDWHFIPRQRQGLHFGDMTDDQKKLVHKLMQTALSDSGYLKATDIIWLESVLYELENQRPMRSPNNYTLVLFGEPTKNDVAWGWRLEGHHLSVNLTYTAEGNAVTPLFLGTNPAVVQQGPLAGKRVISQPHYSAVEFARSMNKSQREKMMLAQKPRDVITSPGRETKLSEAVGVNAAELSDSQRTKLMWLIGRYWGVFEPDHRRAIVDKVLLSEGWPEDIHFAWAGPIDADEAFYYRIHTPTFVIEYSCQGKNHVHAVMHDLTDPLQQDLLKKHFELHEH